MLKIIPPASWDFGNPQVDVIKIASTGFRGADLRSFIKRAGHPLAQWVKDYGAQPGDILVHAIALGGTELYGGNRNGDAYSNAMLQRDHTSFEKGGRWYRNHQNSRPERSYGVIKKAYHNPELQRVEVIAALNGTKEAAERNGGLIADKEMDAIESGRELAVSQSCRVPYDVCMACGNKAKHRGEYCGPDKCTKYGGCRDNLGKVYDDGFHLCVDNPICQFFELSNVSDTRGADRTAFVTGKVAAAKDIVVGGAELAEQLGLVTPEYLLEPTTLKAASALRKLASHTKKIENSALANLRFDWDTVLMSRNVSGLPSLSKSASDEDRHTYLAKLAAAGVILPPAVWLSVCTNAPLEKCAAFFGDSVLSPQELLSNPNVHEYLEAASFPTTVDTNMNYRVYAPTYDSHQRLAALCAMRNTEKRAGTPTAAPAHLEEVKARYLAYTAQALALNENSDNLILLYDSAVLNNRAHQS